MNDSKTCPICSNASAVDIVDPNFTVFRCSGCGHRNAEWTSERAVRLDYYEAGNTSLSESFVASLLETRTRQAGAVIAGAQSIQGKECAWLDYGAGRGALLHAVKAAGQKSAIGFDTSDVATIAMKNSGIETLDLNNASQLERVSIVSLMDVLEHFTDPVSKLQEIISQFHAARLLIIKVPRADSLLYRVASIFHKLGIRQPFRQLYQDGTWPPHFQYFTDQSLKVLEDRLPIKKISGFYDPDFDDIFTRLGFRPNRFLRWTSKAIAPLFKETVVLYFELGSKKI